MLASMSVSRTLCRRHGGRWTHISSWDQTCLVSLPTIASTAGVFGGKKKKRTAACLLPYPIIPHTDM